MVEFTKNELNILDLALKNEKYIISRQDDITRDNMLLYLCKKVIEEFHSQEKKGKVLVVADNSKYDKIRNFINCYIEDDEITIISKTNFVNKANDEVYDCMIYDNLQTIITNCRPNVSDIRNVYNKNKKLNKNFKFLSFYDGFLRKGVLDIYAVMMIYYYNYLLINKLSEPKDFLKLMMDINYRYGKEEVLSINISKMLVNKIKSLVGFDDFRDIGSIDSLIKINNEGMTIYSDDIEISDIRNSFFRLTHFYDYIMNLIDDKNICNGNFINEINLLNKKILTKDKIIKAIKRIINGDAISNPIYQFIKLLELDNNLMQCKIINKYNDILEYGKRLISSNI